MKILTTLLLLLATAAALAQPSHSHTINYINNGSPGGTADVFIDIYEPCLAANNIKVTKTFKNGAEGLVAIQHLLYSTTDTENVTNVITAGAGMLQANNYQNIDTEKQLQPVVYTGRVELALLSVPGRIDTIAELRRLSKTRPVTVGWGGGLIPYAAREWLDALGIDYIPVPYKTSGPAFIDLIRGDLDLVFWLYIDASGMIAANKIQILTSKMSPAMAKRFHHETIDKYVTMDPKLLPFGTLLAVRAGTKRENIAMLYDVVTKCSQDKEVLAKLAEHDTEPIMMTTQSIEKKIFDYHRLTK